MRIRLFVVAVCMILVLNAGCAGPKPNTKDGHEFKIAMVTDTGGLNDESFNQTTDKGLRDCRDKLGMNYKSLESKRDEDYVPNLTRLARGSTDLIWATGFKLMNALTEVANRFPKTRFGIVDSNLNGNIPGNVIAVTSKDQESAFLAGVAAGLTTKKNKVGFIGGIHGEVIESFEVGYTEGVKAVNPNCEVVSAYADSFTEVTKGLSIARSIYNSGADIIFHAAGGVGKGLFDEVKTREKGKYWAIGVDCDQSKLAPNHTLTSVMKRVDIAVFTITKKLKEGQFAGGKEVSLGLKEGAVGIIEDKLDLDVKKEIEKYRQKIICGELVVPKKKRHLKG